MTRAKPMTPETAEAVREVLEHLARRQTVGQVRGFVTAAASLDLDAAEVSGLEPVLPASWHRRAAHLEAASAAEAAELELEDEDEEDPA